MSPRASRFTSKQRAGDPEMLDRLFQDSCADLLQEANAALHDDAAARCVVGEAFHRVWDAETSFQTPRTLGVFLHSEVREAAARERNRRGGVGGSLDQESNNAAIHRPR